MLFVQVQRELGPAAKSKSSESLRVDFRHAAGHATFHVVEWRKRTSVLIGTRWHTLPSVCAGLSDVCAEYGFRTRALDALVALLAVAIGHAAAGGPRRVVHELEGPCFLMVTIFRSI